MRTSAFTARLALTFHGNLIKKHVKFPLKEVDHGMQHVLNDTHRVMLAKKLDEHLLLTLSQKRRKPKKSNLRKLHHK